MVKNLNMENLRAAEGHLSGAEAKPGAQFYVRRAPASGKLVMDFPGGSTGKESTHNVGDPGLIPGLRRCSGEGTGYPLQYSGLEKSVGSQRVGHS